MNKMTLKPIIMSALAAIAFGTVTVGTTFALFTDKAETSIRIGSGKIDVSLEAANLKTYSAEYQTDHYESVLTNVSGIFTNGGTAKFENGSLELSKMTPGDRVTFDVSFENNSNVNYLYRLIFEADSTDATLASGLSIKTNISGEEKTYTHLSRYVSARESREAGNNAIGSLSFDIELPIERGNEYQDKEISYRLAIEAIQGNAHVEDESKVEYFASTFEELKELSSISGNRVVLGNDITVPLATVKSGMIGAREVFEPAKLEIAPGTIVSGNGHKLVLPEFYVDNTTLKLLNSYFIKIGGDNVVLDGVIVDSSHILNQNALIDCAGVKNLQVLNCEFLGAINYTGIGKVFKNVTKDMYISNTTSKNTFAFIYESSGNVLDGTITIEDSFISADAYTVNFGEGVTENAKLLVKDSTLAGWTSFGGLNNAKFENVKFKHSNTKASLGSYHNYFRNYNLVEFNSCIFDVETVNQDLYYGFYIDPSVEVRDNAAMTVFTNCKVNYVSNGEGESLESLGSSNIFKFKEDHDFSCTIDGVAYRVTATEATQL